VGPLTRARGRLRRSAVLTTSVAVLAAVLAAVLPMAPASAETAAQARAAARSAAAEVARLQPQVAAAEQAYERVLEQLATEVTTSISVDEQAGVARELAQAADRDRRRRVRALYISGGGAAVMASVLSAEDPRDLLTRLDSVRRVVRADEGAAKRAAQLASAVRADADRRLAQAERTTTTASDVAAAQRRLLSLVAAAEARLAALSARAARLVEAEAAARALAAAKLAAQRAGLAAAARASARGIPPEFQALYRAAAATCSGLDWHVLAAIGQVESGHGRNTGPSSAGAQGPMQFLPSTFRGYAVDGDQDGDKDIWDPADAIFSAARYLCANGAGRAASLPRAIWHYNHADWYVQMVLRIAGQLAQRYPG